MTEKETTINDKITSIISQLQQIIAENPKNLKKIDVLLKKLKKIGTWQIIDPLKKILDLPNCSSRIIQKILELFGNIQDPRVISILSTYSQHTDSRIRNSAIKSLSLIKNPKVTKHLISALKQGNNDKWVKIFSIHGLRRNASPKVVQPLINLMGDPEEEIRKEALLTLEGLNTDNVDELLIDAISSEDRFIKFGAVNLLGERNVEKSVENLVKLIGNNDLRLNLLVCNTLSKLSSPKSLLPLLEHAVLESSVSNRYVLCIQKMKNSIIPSLIDIYLKDLNNTYKEPLEFILSKTGLLAHEIILDRKTRETNPDVMEKLEILEKNIEN